MWTQHSRITGPPGADGQHRVAVVENGPTYAISQGGDHVVRFTGPDGPVAMPSGEFFATHREATAEEIEKGSADAPTLKTRGKAAEPAS